MYTNAFITNDKSIAILHKTPLFLSGLENEKFEV